MEQAQAHPRAHLFTLRIWLEELGEGNTEWRGRVQNVADGEIAFFRGWPGLVSTLQRMVTATAEVCEDAPEGPTF